MSILRWLGKTIGGFIFFTLLSSAIFMKPVVQFTEYDTLRPIVAEILQTQMMPDGKTEEFGEIREKILDNFDENYYKKYDCEFIQCISQPAEGPEMFMILASEKAHLFFEEMLRLSWIGSAVGAAILLISVDTWTGRARTFGYSFITMGAPFFITGFFRDTLISRITTAEFASSLTPIINQVYDSVSADFTYLLITGVALVIISFIGGRLVKKSQ